MVGGAIKHKQHSFYEGILTIIHKKFGKILNMKLFNIIEDDVRPCLIVELTNFIIVNIHYGWEVQLYNYNKDENQKIKNEEYNENYHIYKEDAKQNLIEIINKNYDFNKNKNIIIFGDFNDTFGNFQFDTLNKKNLNWTSTKLKTCCYNETDKIYKNPGDYIASNLILKNSNIIELNNNYKVIYTNKKNTNNLYLSDHLPIYAEFEYNYGAKKTKKYKKFKKFKKFKKSKKTRKKII